MKKFREKLRWLAWVFCFLGAQPAFAHGVSEADKHTMLTGGLLDYIWLGATHMLTGYDHLLFLFGVIFFLTRMMDVVKFITAFTIGHSITLIFATFAGITANAFLIDAVIALTVCYKGFDNLDGFKKYLKINSPNLLAMVFGFGLIHGFGLSTRLQELPLGDHGLLAKIILFNVGVEVGQILALVVMILILSGWRKTPSFKKFSLYANLGLILAGLYLFGQQIHGYVHERGTHEVETTESHQPHHDDHGNHGNHGDHGHNHDHGHGQGHSHGDEHSHDHDDHDHDHGGHEH